MEQKINYEQQNDPEIQSETNESDRSEQVEKEFGALFVNYPQLSVCSGDIRAAYELIKNTCLRGGIIMTCGNGGSASDAGHIVSELMKSFRMKRPVTEKQMIELIYFFPEEGAYLAKNLHLAIPAISLAGQSALSTAIMNDVAPDMVFAQQVFGYGMAGDLLICISTSGNSKNVINACMVAKTFGIETIGMTGEDGGKLREICDITIRVPACETFRVQEFHLPVYHTLCAMIEIEMFS